MDPIRIGCVQYLNTLPLIEGLRAWRDAQVVTAVPSRLIGMLVEGEVDVALASVIDAARAPSQTEADRGGVTLLPVGMIGCDGPTLTVRVFSRRPIESLEQISVDTDSHTSAVLLRVLMHRLHGRKIRVVDFDAGERGGQRQETAGDRRGTRGGGWPDAVLLIGDKVVTDAPPAAEYPHQMDLGEAWKKLTGLPFVYAAWMCRSGEETTEKVRAAAAMLDRARRHNATRLDWIVASRAGEKHWPADLARTYVGEYLHYGVGEAEREGAAKFVRFAAELGLAPGAELRWA
jgi:chorismate dehydratase